MSTIATSGRGGKIFVSVDGTVFTEVLQAKNISFSGPKANYADTTTLSSPGAVQEFIGTTIDPGTASITVVWNQTDAGQLLLAAQFYAQKLCTFRVEYPAQDGLTTGPKKLFKAFVSEDAAPSLDITKATEYMVELKISGVITDTPGA